MVNARPRRRFYLICLLVLAFFSGSARNVSGQSEGNHYSRPGARVDVLEAIPVVGNRSLEKIHLQYSFDRFTTVWLQDVGTVAASGDLHYAVRRDTILFRVSKKGQELASVPVRTTEVEQLPPGSDEFPPVTNGSWAKAGSDLTTSARIGAIKQALFDSLWNQSITVTACRPDDEGCLLSHWIRITTPTENRQVEVALMLIVNSEAPRGQHNTIGVRFLAREGYRGDPTWASDYSVGQSAKDKVTAWVQQRREAIFGKLPK